MTPAEEEAVRALLRKARTIAVVGLSPNPMRAQQFRRALSPAVGIQNRSGESGA